MKYKALIFDFNGVLWWDTELQEEAWQQTAVNLRGKEFNQEELAEHLHGRNNRHTLEYLLQKSIVNQEELTKLTQLKEQNYREKCLKLGSEFKLSPGTAELLNYLKQRNIPRTIATASEITNMRFFFEHLNLAEWFSLDKVIFDNGIRPGKPAPDIYLEAAKMLNIPTTECVVVEDAKSGMAAAFAANVGYLIALGPANKHAELINVPGVKKTIRQLGEIIDLDLF